MQFSQIIGLDELKNTLISSVKNQHVAHAQLFLGKEGSANLALALAYATFLNCQNPQENDSCGKCNSCHKFNKLIHPDLHFVFPTATTKKITKREEALSASFMKEWRSFVGENIYGNVTDWATFLETENKQLGIPVQEGRNIIRSFSLKSTEATYKILIIWLPELMNVSAANAILKILEEPPPRSIFLLVANQSDRMLTTILSRTQIVVVRSFGQNEVVDYLTTHLALEQTKATQLAAIVEGNMQEAIRLAYQSSNNARDMFVEWMRLCYKNEVAGMLTLMEKFSEIGKENQKSLLQYALIMFRECLTYRLAGEDLSKIDIETLDFVKKFSNFIHEGNIEWLSRSFNEAYRHLERNANVKILFLDLSLQIARRIK